MQPSVCYTAEHIGRRISVSHYSEKTCCNLWIILHNRKVLMLSKPQNGTLLPVAQPTWNFQNFWVQTCLSLACLVLDNICGIIHYCSMFSTLLGKLYYNMVVSGFYYFLWCPHYPLIQQWLIPLKNDRQYCIACLTCFVLQFLLTTLSPTRSAAFWHSCCSDRDTDSQWWN